MSAVCIPKWSLLMASLGGLTAWGYAEARTADLLIASVIGFTYAALLFPRELENHRTAIILANFEALRVTSSDPATSQFQREASEAMAWHLGYRDGFKSWPLLAWSPPGYSEGYSAGSRDKTDRLLSRIRHP